MKQYLKFFKIIIPALVLTLAINQVSATYTAKPAVTPNSSNVSSTNTPISVLFEGSDVYQSILGNIGLGSSSSPVATLDVRGVMFSKYLTAFGNTTVGVACATACGGSGGASDSIGAEYNMSGGDLTTKLLYLNNIDIKGKQGRRKLCVNDVGMLFPCPAPHGEWIRSTPGGHVFNPQADLPVGVERYKIELWGGGGNSVPSNDPNPGNDGNHTNPADNSYVTEYKNGVATGKSMVAESGKMGTWLVGGEGGNAYTNNITDAVAVKGGNGQNSGFYISAAIWPPMPLLIKSAFNPDPLPTIPPVYVTQCIGGRGGVSAKSPDGNYGGYGGEGGSTLNGSTGKQGVNFGSGGGGRGHLAGTLALCEAPIPYSATDWKRPRSAGGGAGGYVVAEFDWVDDTSSITYAIEVGEGGITNRDYGTGRGANGAVRISW
ncbi:MAG: hypothetical protein KBD48_02290 [Candidatus Pacebacteria bacterium]|nr:hypothetical protein [Candidatus Paceibacterota bacterium]